MAVTSLWRIHGRLSRAMNYIKNPEKTVNPTLEGLFAYATQEDKTTKKIHVDDETEEILEQFVSGVNCTPDTAIDEMEIVKQQFDKMGGVIAYHGYQSFGPGEATPQMAHEIGRKLAKELWGEKYQVVVATHLDKANHLHNHFIINTVSFVDGKKFYRSAKDYRDMRDASDRLCREYGLSVIENPKEKGKNYGVWKAEKHGIPTISDTIRADIDRAILSSHSPEAFFRALQSKGYEIATETKSGTPLQRPKLKPPGAKKFFRFRTLGEEYDLQRIFERIEEHERSNMPFPEAGDDIREGVYYYRDRSRKTKGLPARYYYYVYLLHRYRVRPASFHKVPFNLREDLAKLDRYIAQADFLALNDIRTTDDLTVYQRESREKLEQLSRERKELRARLKTEPPETEEGRKDQERMTELNHEIKELRKKLKLSDTILEESEKVRETTEKIREEEERDNDGILK